MAKKKPGKVRFLYRNIDQKSLDEIPDDVPDKVFAKSVIEILYQLNGEWAQFGWDNPPVLGLLYQRSKKQLAPGVEALYLEFAPIPTFAEAWRRTQRMHHAIVPMADALRLAQPLFGIKTPADLVAVVLANEAWSLHHTLPLSPEKAQEYREAADERRIHEHPDRVELRNFIAVDRDGVRYGVMQERDGIVDHLVGTDRPNAAGDRHGLTGDVPNSLHYLMEIIQGLDPEPWEKWWKTHHDYRDERDKRMPAGDK